MVPDAEPEPGPEPANRILTFLIANLPPRCPSRLSWARQRGRRTFSGDRPSLSWSGIFFDCICYLYHFLEFLMRSRFPDSRWFIRLEILFANWINHTISFAFSIMSHTPRYCLHPYVSRTTLVRFSLLFCTARAIERSGYIWNQERLILPFLSTEPKLLAFFKTVEKRKKQRKSEETYFVDYLRHQSCLQQHLLPGLL